MKRILALRFFCIMLWLLLFSCLKSYSQLPAPKEINAPMFRVSIQNGNILVNKTPYFSLPDESGNYLRSTKAVALEYGWQAYGGKAWHQTCKYPNRGIGVQYMHVMRRNDLGHPLSIYGFYNGNYYRSKKFQFTNRISAGLAFGLATFDPNDPLPNYVISSKVNAFIELGLGVAVRLSDRFSLEPGFRFTHFSNGNMKRPQRGINVASYTVGIHNILAHPPQQPFELPLDNVKHEQELVLYLGIGSRQIEFNKDSGELYAETHGYNYLMSNLHLGYNYGLTRRFKLGVSLDGFYDGTNGQEEYAVDGVLHKSKVPFKEKLGLASFIGGEVAIDRLSVMGSLGYILIEKRFEESTPKFEQRLGFKYHFYKNLFAGATLRAYRFRAAKAIEFNIGAKIPLQHVAAAQ